MSHRAQQIVDAIAALITTQVQAAGVKVYTHRRLMLDPEQDELEAVSVDYGTDTADDTSSSGIYWSLSVIATAVFVSAEEFSVRAGLLQLRKDIHRAILANPAAGMPWKITLGLPFVINVLPINAQEPEIGTSGEKLVGALSSEYRVIYTTPIDNPDP